MSQLECRDQIPQPDIVTRHRNRNVATGSIPQHYRSKKPAMTLISMKRSTSPISPPQPGKKWSNGMFMRALPTYTLSWLSDPAKVFGWIDYSVPSGVKG